MKERDLLEDRRRWENNIERIHKKWDLNFEVFTAENIYIMISSRLVACCFEHGNESLKYKKVGEYLEELSDSQLLKEDSATWTFI
jgi:hypothetical protein